MPRRQQLSVLQRKVRGRVEFTNSDRLFFIQLYRWFPSILKAITTFRPETLVRRHRAGFRRYWHWKSRNLGSFNGINVCSITRTVRGNVVTITGIPNWHDYRAAEAVFASLRPSVIGRGSPRREAGSSKSARLPLRADRAAQGRTPRCRQSAPFRRCGRPRFDRTTAQARRMLLQVRAGSDILHSKATSVRCARRRLAVRNPPVPRANAEHASRLSSPV